MPDGVFANHRASGKCACAAVDGQVLQPYGSSVQTVVDVDEKLLNLAEQKARRDGMSLGTLVEVALRAALHIPPPRAGSPTDEVEAVDGDDAFFASLEQVRAFGRLRAARRQVDLC
jgi:hypothetical protein